MNHLFVPVGECGHVCERDERLVHEVEGGAVVDDVGLEGHHDREDAGDNVLKEKGVKVA